MSYRYKLIITISLLIALAFGIGGTLMITASFHTSLKTETQEALKSFEVVQNTLYLLNSLGEQTDLDSLGNALTQMSEQNVGNWQALVLKSEEEVIFQNGISIPKDHGLPVPGENQCSYIPLQDENGHGLLVLSIITLEETKLELIARFDMSMVYEVRDAQENIYGIIFLIVMIFGVISAFAFSVALTKPLRQLTGTTRKIADGDLSRRSCIESQDEFGQLSRDFDAMADKLQENICRLETEVERQERFMGAFAHELKTPMTSVIGFADLLRQGDMDEKTRIQVAEYIYTEGRRLERLSFKLLELLLLKKDELNLKEITLSNFMAEIKTIMLPSVEQKGIELICKGEKEKAFLEPDLVKSLLYNIIDNASKAIEKNGQIKVIARKIENGCQFTITDNGRGMETIEMERITEAFYRVDKARARSQGGVGLGLSLCKQIVELHHGTMEFNSQVGKGTTVRICLYEK